MLSQYRGRTWQQELATAAARSAFGYLRSNAGGWARRAGSYLYNRAPTITFKRFPGKKAIMAQRAQAKATRAIKKFVKKRKFSNQPSAGGKRRKVSIKKRVRALERKTADIMSSLSYKGVECKQLLTTVNTATYDEFAINDAGYIESVLAQLRYYDPSTPGTIITAPGATGSYERKFSIKSYLSATMKNNYQIPVDVKVYTYRCAADTGTSPTSWLDSCLADNASTTKASPLIFPTDANDMGDLWKLDGVKSYRLRPGATVTHGYGVPLVSYDPSEYDNHVFASQPDFKTSYIVIRLTGVVTHDSTTTTLVGLAPGGLDIIYKRVSNVRYNAGGPSMTYTYILPNSSPSQGYDTVATGLVSQVVVDNQSYSTT